MFERGNEGDRRHVDDVPGVLTTAVRSVGAYQQLACALLKPPFGVIQFFDSLSASNCDLPCPVRDYNDSAVILKSNFFSPLSWVNRHCSSTKSLSVVVICKHISV